MKKYVASLLLCSLAGTAMAIDDYSKSVNKLGVQSGVAYFGIKEGFGVNCKYEIIYIDITTDFGRLAYSNILSAKAAGLKLSWVNYTQASLGGICSLNLVEVGE